MKAILFAFLLLVLVGARNAFYAEIRSCSGWKLNRLPKVKEFIKQEAEKYEGVEVKYVGGDPRVVFYDSERNPITDEINLSEMDKDSIH